MVSRIKLKESFEVTSKHGAFFTGNQVQWTSDGQQLLCQDGIAVRLFGLEEGHVIGSLCTSEGVEEASNDDLVTAFVLSPDDAGEVVITSHRSGLFHMWKREDQKLARTWKSIHKGPIVKLAIDSSCEWLASGGTDSCIRLWDLDNFSCVHSLKGCQGVVSALKFRPDKKEVFAAADDATIRSWMVGQSEPRLTLSSHYSQVTALVFHTESDHLVSCGRDSVVCLWDLNDGALKKTVPVYESLEAMVLLPNHCLLPGGIKLKKKDGIHVATGGERGIIRIWQVEKAKEIFSQSNSQVAAAAEQGGLSVMGMLFNEKNNTLAVISVDHNIVFHHLDTFDCVRLLAGFCDEILDVALLGESESHIAVASNSPDIKLYRGSDMHCQLLRGHSDLVLALATTPANKCILASAAKDNSVRIWLLNPENGKVNCVASGERHTASVGTVALSHLNATCLLSAAQDECLKMWRLPQNLSVITTPVHLTVEYTEVAHQKDINCVCISPNDKLIATTSQDKTAKLWSCDGLSLVGVLRGHKRGVWCARFSPTDQVLATGSADGTTKLWSIADLSCLKTFEGHDASVLRLEFVSSGAQILTAGGDGLVKLWTIKNGECVTTLDGHEGRVWALTVDSKEEKIMTGGGDSTLLVWRDTTLEKQEENRNTTQKKLLGEQRLSNLMQSKDYETALEVALTLNRPHASLKSIEGLAKGDKDRLGTAINKLPSDLQTCLLQFALSWNTNTRSCEHAQLVLEHLLNEDNVKLKADDLAQALAYTDKHFRRLSQLRSEMQFLTYTAERMSLLPTS